MQDIVIRRTIDQPVLAIRHAIPATMFQSFLEGAFSDLYEFLEEAGVEPEGPPMARYHAFGPEVIDVEVCLPVPTGTIGAGRIVPGLLPAATVATLVHVGPYDDEGEAYAALERWLEMNGHARTGPAAERYLVGPSDGVPPAEYRTQIEMPIDTALVAAPVH